VIVVDSSALVIAAVEESPRGARVRNALLDGAIAPHLIDAEVGQGLRKMVLRGELESASGLRALGSARRLVTRRLAHGPLSARAWELRENVSFYDALYVALAEARRLTLLTADTRLARAPGTRCDFEVV
jgi:predicted nucleic acid-binding protein